jgi:hypothetical protein
MQKELLRKAKSAPIGFVILGFYRGGCTAFQRQSWPLVTIASRAARRAAAVPISRRPGV